MNGCIYRTKDGECDLYGEGGKFHAFCVGDEPCEGRRQTNYDRIISKTPEELADELMTAFAAFYEVEWSKDAVLDWLKQEVEN